MATTSRQVGITLGVAVLGAVAGGSLENGIGRAFAETTRPLAGESWPLRGSRWAALGYPDDRGLGPRYRSAHC